MSYRVFRDSKKSQGITRCMNRWKYVAKGYKTEGFFEFGLPTFICIPLRKFLQSFCKRLFLILNLQQQLSPIASLHKPWIHIQGVQVTPSQYLNPFPLAPTCKRMVHDCSVFYLLPFHPSEIKQAFHLNYCKFPWGDRITLWWSPSNLF